MKAILLNGEIKSFSTVPKTWSDDNGLHLNIGDGSAFGFKDVVLPFYDELTQELTNLHLDGDVFTYDVIDKPIKESLAQLKEIKISELKSKASEKLSKTDWYIIREVDSGEATPQSVKDERANVRSKSNDIEAEINALTTKKSVVTFPITL